MSKRFGVVALECLFDLGITVVYAGVVGLFIVGIVASDDGPISILHAGVYAMLLPLAVIALIGSEIGLRIFKEWRANRRAVRSITPSHF